MSRTHEELMAEADRLHQMADELEAETSEDRARFDRAMERLWAIVERTSSSRRRRPSPGGSDLSR